MGFFSVLFIEWFFLVFAFGFSGCSCRLDIAEREVELVELGRWGD